MLKKAGILKQNSSWDDKVIDQTYAQLLDDLGWLLDQHTITGCDALFRDIPALRFYFKLLGQIESELLIQWNIKQEKGLPGLFLRQKAWLHQELRRPDGFFYLWNQFRLEIIRYGDSNGLLLSTDRWKHLLLSVLTDAELWNQHLGDVSSQADAALLNQICTLFSELYNKDPYHLTLGFLNLIEIGTQQRPEISRLGEMLQLPKAPFSPKMLFQIAEVAEQGENWNRIPSLLLEFWKKNSGGTLSSFPSFTISRRSETDFKLSGAVPERWHRFEDLVGIDSNKQRLVQNVEAFLDGGYFHHTLLWGGRGTGKSSCVLALMDQFADRGLRLIEIPQDDLALIPKLSLQLSGKPESFILFCDDLSFEKDNTNYKYLKTILEGSVIHPSNNLMFIATANRKDLVFRGDLNERNPEEKQLIDEKRAIDDRFGLKLFFEVPVFKDLQTLLFQCAEKQGLSFNKAELLREFNRFAQRNNHDQPSGRTVNQFINDWQFRQSL